MLGNVLGMFATSSAVFGMFCNVLGMLGNVLGRPWHAYNLGVPHRRKTALLCLISCEAKGVVYHQTSDQEVVVHYSFASKLIR